MRRTGDISAVTTLIAVVLGAGCAPGTSSDLAEGESVAFPLPAIDWNPRRYPCLRTPQPPSIDGRMDEEVWAAAPWTETFVDIRGGDRPAPNYPTRARMLWDDDHLYVGVWMVEPHIWGTLTERDSVIYLDPDFEIFLDPDDDTHDYLELEINALGTEWDLRLTMPYRDGAEGEQVAFDDFDFAGLRSAVHIDGTLNDPSDEDRGWGAEFAIPWESIRGHAGDSRLPPTPGDRWRVGFSRVEWWTDVVDGKYVKRTDPDTGEDLPEENWVWSPQGLIAMHYPEMWGFVVFLGPREAVAELEIPLRPVDHGRWLLRRLYYRQRIHHATHRRYSTDLAELGFELGAGSPGVEVTADGWRGHWKAEDGTALRIDQQGRVRVVAPD